MIAAAKIGAMTMVTIVCSATIHGQALLTVNTLSTYWRLAYTFGVFGLQRNKDCEASCSFHDGPDCCLFKFTDNNPLDRVAA